MFPHPTQQGRTEFCSLLSAILPFYSAVIWTASFAGKRTLSFHHSHVVCSHWWCLGVWRDCGCSELTTVGQGRAEREPPNITPAPETLGVPVSLCCGRETSSYLTSAWPAVSGQGTPGAAGSCGLSSHSISQGSSCPSGWQPDHCFPWFYIASLVPGCDSDTVGLLVALCKGAFCSAPAPLAPQALQNPSWSLCSAQCRRCHRLPARL